MKRFFSRVCKWVVLLAVVFAANGARAIDSASVKDLFQNPPRQYSTSPLWVWNDMLTEEQIVSTLRDLAGQNVRQAFIHPRPGLMTPYLSKDWFRLWKVALKEAERLDMNIWIYDENSYPSGFAGGLVSEAMPEARHKGLYTEKINDVVGLYHRDGKEYNSVAAPATKLSQSEYMVAYRKPIDSTGWYAGKFYVDLLKPGVTEKFLEITMDAYRREIGDEFGKRVPGVFTDEPSLRRSSGYPWPDDMDEVSEKRWGYRLSEHIPSLFEPLGDYKRVRHNYHQTLHELFVERWSKPYYEYCQKNNLKFTGHYWEHRWPGGSAVPDSMALYAWHQMPGIDALMNRYDEGSHAQFGNVRAVKEVSSVANQLGQKRVLCEAYGAAGWDLRFEDIKRIGDWLYVLGVNFLNEHLSYITIRGARKRDYPQSFSYHTPWWPHYNIMASYFTRLSAVLSQGEQVNKILVLEPTTTVWMYQPDSSHKDRMNEIADQFQHIVVDLAKAQVEYDLGCEDIMARHGSVEGAALKVGNRVYDTVILPPLCENLNNRTMELLESYAKSGGKVLCCGEPPSLVDAVASDRGKTAAQNAGWKRVKTDELMGILLHEPADGFAIKLQRSSEGIIYHHRRKLDDGELLFIVNTSIDSKRAGLVVSRARSVEKWDPETGAVTSYPFDSRTGGIQAGFDLAPCGSLLLFLSNKPGKSTPVESTKRTNILPAGGIKVRRIESNVLTLDYVDVTAGGETRTNTYLYEASRFVFQKHGMQGNPWDSAVQFRDELISKKFPADSGFEATYRFTIEGDIPKLLYIVIERPDLYAITCNNKAVSAEGGSWWLDKSFGKIDITSAARQGENAVTIKASPMTMYHELESAYVLGDFSLKASDSGFVIVADAPLKLGPWNEQGCPLYSADVSYLQNFKIARPKGRYIVSLGRWFGSVAQVTVNGKPAGHIYHQPWEQDVTEFITAGDNTIEVVVIGTLRNTLGPYHGNPDLGWGLTRHWQKAPTEGPPPGSKYSTIKYGLFETFELQRIDLER